MSAEHDPEPVREYLEAGKRLEEAAEREGGEWLRHDLDGNGRCRDCSYDILQGSELATRFVNDARDRLPRYRKAIEYVMRIAETESTKRDAVGVCEFTPGRVLYLIARALLGEEKADAECVTETEQVVKPLVDFGSMALEGVEPVSSEEFGEFIREVRRETSG